MTAIERTMSSTSTKLTARSSSSSLASSTRKQNRSQFAKYYSDLCHVQHLHPLNVIKQNLDKGILDFYCDRIKFEEWWSIINALSCDKSLHLIAIRSRHPQRQAVETADTELKAKAVIKQPVITTRFVLLWLVEAIKTCLARSSALTVLELEGLPLTGDYLSSLSRGLLETSTLQHLSLTKCLILDEGAELVCHAIRNLPCVLSLDLSQCGLTERGAEIIAGLIKYQKLNRYSEAWKQTLRYRDPDVEAMPGLRRITVNGNQGIGDKGISILVEEIKDDLWLRALDVQDCGLTDEGGRILLDLLESNTNLSIVDGRGNPFMNEKILLEIMNQLALNNQNKNNSEYKWINKNPDLNKKKSQMGTARPRPWTCQSSACLVNKAPPPSECASAVNLARLPQLKRSNTTLGQGVVRSKSQKESCEKFANNESSENERLRLQLRDLTLILSQEVRHKLALMEENRTLKELLEKENHERKKLEEAQNNKMLIAEDTLKVLEETISKFGMYIEQKQREEEETSESTTARSTDENDIPELVSNLKVLLKNSRSSTDKNINDNKKCNQKHKKKVNHLKSELLSQLDNENNNFIDIQVGDRKEEDKAMNKPQTILEKLKMSRWLKNKPEDQTIWEEDETSSNCGDLPRNNRTDPGKLKAQAMFMKILEEGRQERVISYSTGPDIVNSHDEVSSNESEYDFKSPEIPEKPLSSSYDENSS